MPTEMVGRILEGKYHITALIGAGGMSAVYQAQHLALGRVIAIKVLHPTLADDPEAIARLRHEAQVVGTIGHPNICEIFDLGRTSDGRPYLTMERLEGYTLGKRLKEGGPMPFTELAPIIRQVLGALVVAHEKGILHRDLKPENVFLQQPRAPGETPLAKLLDFGISKTMHGTDFGYMQRLTHTGMVMGTPYYMAPEQARGDSNLDQRVDLWAVAVILYEALTGRRPFVAGNYNALLVKILTLDPRPIQKLRLDIPDVVAALVARGLAKMRADRYQSARQFLEALVQAERQCRVSKPSEQRPATIRSRLQQAIAKQSAGTEWRGDWSERIENPDTFIDDEQTEVDRPLPSPMANREAVQAHPYSVARPGRPAASASRLAGAPLEGHRADTAEPTHGSRSNDGGTEDDTKTRNYEHPTRRRCHSTGETPTVVRPSDRPEDGGQQVAACSARGSTPPTGPEDTATTATKVLVRRKR